MHVVKCMSLYLIYQYIIILLVVKPVAYHYYDCDSGRRRTSAAGNFANITFLKIHLCTLFCGWFGGFRGSGHLLRRWTIHALETWFGLSWPH